MPRNSSKDLKRKASTLPRRHTVDSSHLQSVGYKDHSLYIKFQNSSNVYEYQGVPEAIANLLEQAPSKGKFYQTWIKGIYDNKVHKND